MNYDEAEAFRDFVADKHIAGQPAFVYYDDGSPHLVIGNPDGDSMTEPLTTDLIVALMGQLRAAATHLTEQRGHQA